MSDVSRLAALDGLRGVAVIGVVAFHFFSRFPNFYPYADNFIDLARYGSIGVQLFFIVSGFVIALTLEHTTGMVDFAIRRFSRLWPPMLVCSIITFATLHIIDSPFTNFRRVGLEGFLPSLTFIDPGIWARLVKGAAWIDGAYWSLFVEVRFYFWAAVIYWMAPRYFSLALLMLAVSATGLDQLTQGNFLVNVLLFPKYISFFSVGALFYDLWRGRNGKWRWPAVGILIVLSIFSMLERAPSPTYVALILLCFLPFFALVLKPETLRLVASKPLTWIGRRSYSLYLLHQNVGVAIITLAPTGLSLPTYFVVVIAVFSLLLLLAHCIFEMVEQKSPIIVKVLSKIFKTNKRRSRPEPIED